jgi:hypothetical protein
MPSPLIRPCLNSVQTDLRQGLGLPFAALLPADQIEEALETHQVSYRQRLFTPIVTLWAFLSQVLDKNKACTDAVSRVASVLVAQGQSPPSTDASAYCQARNRLPEAVVRDLYQYAAQQLDAQVETDQLWHGRKVVLIDGSTVSMPDTIANQLAYPQHGNQKPGCGFPLARIVGLFSLTTGALTQLQITPFKIAEPKVARQLYSALDPGSILVGDAQFGSYSDLWMLEEQQVDGLFRPARTRYLPVRNSLRFGKGDWLVPLEKPINCPPGIERSYFKQLPQTRWIRVLRYVWKRPGFRDKKYTLITTLLDPLTYTKDQLIALYGRRWQVEVDLRRLKTTMNMEVLRTHTPERVRKEIYCHLLAYNLIRTLMWQTGQCYAIEPLHLSFKGTIRQVMHLAPYLALQPDSEKLQLMLIQLIAAQQVPQRPGRTEPRVLKRKHKRFPAMNKPRAQLKGPVNEQFLIFMPLKQDLFVNIAGSGLPTESGCQLGLMPTRCPYERIVSAFGKSLRSHAEAI